MADWFQPPPLKILDPPLLWANFRLHIHEKFYGQRRRPKIVVVDVNPSPKDDPADQKIRHFRVPPGLCIKTRLSAQPLIWKLFFISCKIIFTTKFCARVGLILKVRVFGTRKWPIAESPTGDTDFARRVTPVTKDQPVNQKMAEIQLDFSEELFEDNWWVKGEKPQTGILWNIHRPVQWVFVPLENCET